MKGTIAVCMQDLVTTKFGAGKWKESLTKAGFKDSKTYTVLDDIPDQEVLQLMKGIAAAASLSMAQVMEAFGEHWSTIYAPTVYSAYFGPTKSARELLLNLDHIHDAMTHSMRSAKPPRFKYEWKDDRTLIMTYESSRGMIALMPGLIRGVGKHFKEDLKVTVTGNHVEVQFP
jgi:hypothetical protein